MQNYLKSNFIQISEIYEIYELVTTQSCVSMIK